MGRSGSAREKWSRIIREQQASGLSVAAFCAQRGVAESSFYPWKRKLSEAGDTATRDDAPTFVEATIRGVAEECSGVTVELPCGRRVTVTRGFDRRLLLEVLDTLESNTGAAS
jgi:transposase-like protein